MDNEAIKKDQIWNQYVGEDKFITMCFRCELQDIAVTNFYIATVENELKPVCQACYDAMNSKLVNKEELELYRKYMCIYLDKLCTEELNIIGKMCHIGETARSKLIKKLVEVKFDHERFMRNILEEGSERKLKKLCSLHGLTDLGPKDRLISRLLKSGITLEKISDKTAQLNDNTQDDDDGFYDSDDELYDDDLDDCTVLVNTIVRLLKDKSEAPPLLIRDDDVIMDMLQEPEKLTRQSTAPKPIPVPLPVVPKPVTDKLDDGLDDDIDILDDIAQRLKV